MSGFIPLSVPNLKGNELKYIHEAISSEWVSTSGPYIKIFEKNIAEYLHANTAVAVQSGTAGLHLSLLASGVCPGDAVIAPTLTFIATINPIKYCGATPIFMDSDDSLCMDMEKLAHFCETECEFINGSLYDRATHACIKAVIVVHVFGNMADMERAVEICNTYNLTLIEDATEALGSICTDGKYSGKYAGTIGDIGVYSFNGNKIITTGGGGMIVARDKKILENVRYLSTQAKDDELYFLHNEVGYNYRMTNLQAALGVAQLEQLDTFIETKKANYFYYNELGVKLLPFRDAISPNYWFYSFCTDDRDRLISFLGEHNIQSRPVWKLNHTQKPYVECPSYKIEKASTFYNSIVNLPCSSNLSKDDVKYVSDLIKEFNHGIR